MLAIRKFQNVFLKFLRTGSQDKEYGFVEAFLFLYFQLCFLGQICFTDLSQTNNGTRYPLLLYIFTCF